MLSGGVAEGQSWTQQLVYQYPAQYYVEYYVSDYGSTLMQASDGNLYGTELETATWFRATPSGFNFDTLLSYADDGQLGQPYGLSGRPLAASDGNL